MQNRVPISLDIPSRELIRLLRTQPEIETDGKYILPESVLWHVFCELRRRGEGRTNTMFIRSVRNLHRRRTIGAADLPITAPAPQEHKMVDDPLLATLWQAYKRCICSERPGPASQLLRDIELQLAA